MQSFLVGVATVPSYPGARDRRRLPTLGGRISLGGRLVALEGQGIRAKLVTWKGFAAGPLGSFTLSRPARDSLPAIGTAFELGAFAEFSRPRLFARDDELSIRSQATRDVTGAHDGWLSELAASYRRRLTRRTTVGSQIALKFADADYKGSYFRFDGETVDGERGLLRTGPISVGASLSLVIRASPRVSLLVSGSRDRFIGTVAKSPVLDAPSSNRAQVSSMIGLVFVP